MTHWWDDLIATSAHAEPQRPTCRAAPATAARKVPVERTEQHIGVRRLAHILIQPEKTVSRIARSRALIRSNCAILGT